MPAPASAWGDAAWRNVPTWRLLRNESDPRFPRFPTEIKALHDGHSLAVLARCIEPGEPVTRVKENEGPVNHDDNFQVYLATSGSAYVQFVVNSAGYLLDDMGFLGGERLSRAREWNSGARVVARREAGAWTVRLDIPLGPVAMILGEDGIPAEWRVLFRRVRRSRTDEPQEESELPVTQSDTPLCTPRYRRLRLAEAAPSTLAHVPPPAMPTGLAALDGRVLSPEERNKVSLPSMLRNELEVQFNLASDEVRREWEQVSTHVDWEHFRDRRIGALKASFGEFPPRTPLRTRITKEFEGNGYRRQDIIYQSSPGMWVTANFYLPANPHSPMPAIVIVHSHHRPRSQAELQDMGILWARANCAVLIMDQIGHGERLQNYPWNREPYHSRYIMGMQLYLAGESLLKWMVWDVIRGIDLLLERKDVNPDQIILLGAVAGGGEPAAVTAALDSRVAAVAPFNFGLAEPEWGEWESTRCPRRTLVDDHAALAGLRVAEPELEARRPLRMSDDPGADGLAQGTPVGPRHGPQVPQGGGKGVQQRHQGVRPGGIPRREQRQPDLHRRHRRPRRGAQREGAGRRQGQAAGLEVRPGTESAAGRRKRLGQGQEVRHRGLQGREHGLPRVRLRHGRPHRSAGRQYYAGRYYQDPDMGLRPGGPRAHAPTLSYPL